MIPHPTDGTPARAAIATTNNATVTASTAASPGNSLRWIQLALGIVCMAMIANVQYGWTLFVAPMEAKHRGGERERQAVNLTPNH